MLRIIKKVRKKSGAELALSFLTRCNKLCFPILNFAEKFLIKSKKGSESYPPIFIIGAPRTGSTILYQMITHQLNVGYISNFECAMYKTTKLGSRLHRLFFGTRKHNSFSSVFGATPGLNSPSECGEFWYRWFPKTRHYVAEGELSQKAQQEMREVIYDIAAVKSTPLLFKNLNCGQRLRALHEVFPEALFIFCKRDPVYTAQSLLQVREKLFGSTSEWWSIMPKEYSTVRTFPATEQVVAQVYYIEKEINEALTSKYPDNYVNIHYEDLCERPQDVLNQIRSFLKSNSICLSEAQTDISCNLYNDNKKQLGTKTFNEIKSNVAKYFETIS